MTLSDKFVNLQKSKTGTRQRF